MRILMTNYMETTYPGGINKVIEETAMALSKNGHKIIVIQPNPFNLPEKESYKGFDIIRIKPVVKELYGFNLNVYLRIRKLLKNHPVDLAHIHGYQTFFSLLALKAVKDFDKDLPVIFSPHTDIYRNTLAGKYLWRIYDSMGKSMFHDSDCILSPSNFEAQHVASNYHIKEEAIPIISHGVDFIDKNKIKTEQNKSCKLLYSGHLVERKGVNHILDGLNTLINEMGFKNVELTIIGEGPEKNNLMKLCGESNLNDHVMWKPFLPKDKLIQEIRDADIFLLLSNSEAYGIIVAEVLALGTPCIVTKKTALAEFLNEPGCFGVEYPPDPREVANLIKEIYESDIDIGPFSEKIRTWDKVAADYEKLYLNTV